jgi:signal transduction histidine kinase
LVTADLQDIFSLISVVVYGAVAVAAWRLHRRVRSVRSRWLLLTFLTLAGVVVVSFVLPDVTAGSGALLRFAQDVLIVVLLFFPYCLYRFAAGFRKAPPLLEIVAHGALAALVVWTFILPTLPQERSEWTAGMQAYLAVLLVYWTVVSLWAAWELWRGGRGQPGVARRRMQLLGAGALVMNVALLVAGVGGGGDNTALSTVTTMLGWAAAGLFLLGFAPPGTLRHSWRQGDERRLRRAEATLMTATTAEEVADTIVPHVAELLGGHGAALLDRDGQALASLGFTEADLQGLNPGVAESLERDRLVLPLSSGCLVLQASVYAPFFGDEELELLRSLGTFVDLALSRIELSAQERLTRKELERTNEELTALVYGISHDLRSPIVTVIGYLELLGTDTADELSDEAKHYLERISLSARYMDSLIRDLLELSRIGRTQTDVETVDLTDLVSDVGAELSRTHPDASFAVDPLPPVAMNPVRARQLFTNLMENAVRHGGRPDIAVAVSAERTPEGDVVVSVTDNGVGIDEAYRERVFGIFERLDSDMSATTTGTGIGLAMCRKIVEGVDGSIWIDPSVEGTTFKIALPATPTQQSSKDVEVQRQ